MKKKNQRDQSILRLKSKNKKRRSDQRSVYRNIKFMNKKRKRDWKWKENWSMRGRGETETKPWEVPMTSSPNNLACISRMSAAFCCNRFLISAISYTCGFHHRKFRDTHTSFSHYTFIFRVRGCPLHDTRYNLSL